MKKLKIILAANRLDLLSDEEILESGLHEAINDVKQLLSYAKALPSGAYESNQIDELISKIEEVVCYIEDAVDSRGIRYHKLRREYDAGKRSCFSLSSCLRRLYDPIIRLEIKELYDPIKLAIMSTRDQQLAFAALFSLVEEKSDQRCQGQRVNLLAQKHDSYPVGLNKVKAQLIQHLLEKGDNLEVTWLCGIGGVGKTTLAKQIFSDQRVQKEFSTKIWIEVSSKFKTKNILLDILGHFTSETEVEHSTSESELVDLVRHYLRESERFLVVLDDIWSIKCMDELCRFFPENQNGSRILLTTRNLRVANSYWSQKPTVYPVDPLEEVDAWELFMKTIRCLCGPAYKLDAYKEKIGMEMVKLCGGLPVAIIGLGQELAARKTSDEWDIVYQNTSSFLNERVLEVLAPSFDDLPDHLKVCFLYLGIWPEDSMIDVEKLNHFWTVEGLVKPESFAAREALLLNAADFYLAQLAWSGMVEVVEDESSILRPKSCHIHTMIRQLCISKGNQIDFSHTIDFRRDSDSSSYSIYKPRRLFVYLERPEDLSSILNNKELTEHLRILQLLDSYKHQNREPIRLSGKLEYKELRLLRVLDFDGVDFRQSHLLAAGGMANARRHIGGLLEWIACLVNLRYLSFKGCILDQLPAMTINNLWHLQILDLRVNNSSMEVRLPNVLWKLRKLKHLYLPRTFRTYDGEKLRLDNLTELETLDNFITRVCTVTDLHTLTKLLNLAVRIDASLPDLEYITEHVKQNMQIQLSMDIINFDCYTEDRHYVVRQVLQSQAVRTFCIEGHICELPPKYKISRSLIKIVLSGSELEKDPMETLSELPELSVLVLDDDAFVGKIMISPASGFRELKRLELSSLQYLEKWEVGTNSMPKLSSIKIENCNNLVKIPKSCEDKLFKMAEDRGPE